MTRDARPSTTRWAVVFLPAAACLLVTAVAAAQEPAALSDVKADGRTIVWSPRTDDYGALRLSVTGSGWTTERTFEAGERPVLELVGKDGEPLPDGTYKWELRRIPRVDPELRERLQAARETHDPDVMALMAEKIRPRGPTSQNGTFSLIEGKLIDDQAVERQRPFDPNLRGDTLIDGDLEVKGRKAFVATVPGTPGRELHFVALEGPEAGTYYRGSARLRDGEAVIELPEHFRAATEPEGLTVQLTPVGGWSRLYVVEKSAARLVVRSAEGDPEAELDFLVQGVRRGFADHRPERPSGR